MFKSKNELCRPYGDAEKADKEKVASKQAKERQQKRRNEEQKKKNNLKDALLI